MKYLGFQLGFHEVKTLKASSMHALDSYCTINSAMTQYQYPELVRTQMKNKGRS